MKISKKRLSLLVNEVYKGMINTNLLDVIETVPSETIYSNPNISGQAGIDYDDTTVEPQQDGTYRLSQSSIKKAKKQKIVTTWPHVSQRMLMSIYVYGYIQLYVTI